MTGISRERVLSILLEDVLFMTKPVDVDVLMERIQKL